MPACVVTQKWACSVQETVPRSLSHARSQPNGAASPGFQTYRSRIHVRLDQHSLGCREENAPEDETPCLRCRRAGRLSQDWERQPSPSSLLGRAKTENKSTERSHRRPSLQTPFDSSSEVIPTASECPFPAPGWRATRQLNAKRPNARACCHDLLVKGKAALSK